MRQLDELVVLVTGGSRGIGRALVLALVDAGATVYTCATSNRGLDETVQACEGPGAVVAQTADVTKPAQVDKLLERIRADEGRLDALVNNAGVLGPRAPIEEVAIEEWRRTMSVNLDGVFIASKGAIPLLRESAAGVMVNISSSVGREGRGGWGPYAVSKHGVEGLTDTLADELAADDIAVVSANPGGTATDMRAEAYPEEDPDTLPGAAEVAETLALLIRTVGVDQTAAKYDCRELFDAVDQDVDDPSTLPTAT